MSDRTNAQLLQVFRRQPRQDRIVDLILSECRLVSFEVKTPQPTLDVYEALHLLLLRHRRHSQRHSPKRFSMRAKLRAGAIAAAVTWLLLALAFGFSRELYRSRPSPFLASGPQITH